MIELQPALREHRLQRVAVVDRRPRDNAPSRAELVELFLQVGDDALALQAQVLARLVVGELSEISTVTRAVSRRGGKVYIDYLQNISGQLIASPFSVRPLPGAPVSTPLDWREVTRKLDIRAFTLQTVPERMKQRKTDPMREVLDLVPDLGSVLQRLASRGDGKGSA